MTVVASEGTFVRCIKICWKPPSALENMYPHIINTIIKLWKLLSSQKIPFVGISLMFWLKTAADLISFLMLYINGVIKYAFYYI